MDNHLQTKNGISYSSQLNSTPLGHWTHNGHQRWDYCLENGAPVLIYEIMQHNVICVDVAKHPKLRIIGTKPAFTSKPHHHIPNTPLLAIQNVPKWIKNLWRTTK